MKVEKINKVSRINSKDLTKRGSTSIEAQITDKRKQFQERMKQDARKNEEFKDTLGRDKAESDISRMAVERRIHRIEDEDIVK